MTYYESAIRILIVPLAAGLFIGSLIGFAITIGAISSGIPILTIGLVSIVAMFISLDLWNFILTGEDAPPWWD